MKYQVTIKSVVNNKGELVGFKAVITDTETGIEVAGKVQPYTRTKDGETVQFMQIAFDAKELGCENKGIVQVPKTDEGKFMKQFETNLDNRRNSTTKLSFDMFA